jgi:hypothetical protein
MKDVSGEMIPLGEERGCCSGALAPLEATEKPPPPIDRICWMYDVLHVTLIAKTMYNNKL